MAVIQVADVNDPRLLPYRDLTDSAARRGHGMDAPTFLAESFPVLERALGAGYAPVSVLAQERWAARCLELLPADVPIYVVSAAVAEQLTGFAVHRGAIAVMRRKALRAVSTLIDGADRLLVLEDVSDSTNIGTLFRNGAALGVDAIILTPQASDPLYRRSVRVSMGTVFQVPWTRASSWTELHAALSTHGFSLAALALSEGATPLAEYTPSGRVALAVGAEGPGLSATALDLADTIVTIPMRHGVDSLNVATAAAIALWALGC